VESQGRQVARRQRPRLTHLDTHVVCWLYAGRVEELSPAARAVVEVDRLAVSPMVGLELQYLREIGRMRHAARRILAALRRDIGLAMSDQPFAAVAARAMGFRWTRDPFDRLIAAEASLAGARLLTRDEALRRHFRGSVW
jgi:PIN domain nuclease of toxin-antitoxin system